MANEYKKVTLSPLTVGIAGAIIGAAGAALTIALSDKKNREKIAHTVDDARMWSGKKFQELRGLSAKSRERINEELDKMEDEAIEAMERNRRTGDIASRQSPQVVK